MKALSVIELSNLYGMTRQAIYKQVNKGNLTKNRERRKGKKIAILKEKTYLQKVKSPSKDGLSNYLSTNSTICKRLARKLINCKNKKLNVIMFNFPMTLLTSIESRPIFLHRERSQCKVICTYKTPMKY